MGLDLPEYVTDFTRNWPLPIDGKKFGAPTLRGMKRALVNSFPLDLRNLSTSYPTGTALLLDMPIPALDMDMPRGGGSPDVYEFEIDPVSGDGLPEDTNWSEGYDFFHLNPDLGLYRDKSQLTRLEILIEIERIQDNLLPVYWVEFGLSLDGNISTIIPMCKMSTGVVKQQVGLKTLRGNCMIDPLKWKKMGILPAAQEIKWHFRFSENREPFTNISLSYGMIYARECVV